MAHFSLQIYHGIFNSSISLYSIAGLVLAILWFGQTGKFPWRSTTIKLPPGPIGLPILGSFPFLHRCPELSLDRWAKKYGNIYSMRLGTDLFVVLSDPAIVKHFFVTNGSIFSSRKFMYMKSKIICENMVLTSTPYNDTWRKHIRIATEFLGSKAIARYSAAFSDETNALMKGLLDASKCGTVPIDLQSYIGRCILNNMLQVTFGTRTDSIEDPLVEKALNISREFMNLTGAMSNAIDFFPVLQYLPNRITTRGKQLNQDIYDTWGGLAKDIEKKMENNEELPDSLTTKMLKMRNNGEKLSHTEITMLAAAFMIGGVETTASVLHWCAGLIAKYPNIQQRAQQELDDIIGRDRLPGIEDMAKLPYCRAIIKEVERFRNPFPVPTPHFSTDDFIYKDFLIPKGTVVVMNAWTLHHDPQQYRDPYIFNPERYLNDALTSSQSAKQANPYKRDHWIFGVGRRICPGMMVADQEIWLSVVRLLWSFKMTELPDKPINLDEYSGLSGRSPVPFKVNLVPRHNNVEKILDDETIYDISL